MLNVQTTSQALIEFRNFALSERRVCSFAALTSPYSYAGRLNIWREAYVFPCTVHRWLGQADRKVAGLQLDFLIVCTVVLPPLFLAVLVVIVIFSAPFSSSSPSSFIFIIPIIVVAVFFPLHIFSGFLPVIRLAGLAPVETVEVRQHYSLRDYLDIETN